MASRLTPCPSCSRHVKVGAPVCAFCGGNVPIHVPERVVLGPPGRPLTRAAMLFAGAAAIGACSSSSGGEAAPAYGVAAMFDGSTAAGGDAGDDARDASTDGEFVTHYGVAAMPDAGPGGTLDAAYGVFTGGDDAGPGGSADAAYGVFTGGHDAGPGGSVDAAYGVFAGPDSGTP